MLNFRLSNKNTRQLSHHQSSGYSTFSIASKRTPTHQINKLKGKKKTTTQKQSTLFNNIIPSSESSPPKEISPNPPKQPNMSLKMGCIMWPLNREQWSTGFFSGGYRSPLNHRPSVLDLTAVSTTILRAPRVNPALRGPRRQRLAAAGDLHHVFAELRQHRGSVATEARVAPGHHTTILCALRGGFLEGNYPQKKTQVEIQSEDSPKKIEKGIKLKALFDVEVPLSKF